MKFGTVEQYINKLNNLFHVVVALPLLAFVVLYLQIHKGVFEPIVQANSLVTALRYPLPFLVMLTGGLAFISYKRNLISSKNQHSLHEKLVHFYKASAVKFAFLGAASLVAVLGLFLTMEDIYTVLYLIVLMLLSLNRPTVQRISRDLKLRDTEKDIVINKKEVRPPVKLESV